MVQVVEVIAEFKADGFINVGRGTRARVIRPHDAEQYGIEVDDVVKGVAIPSGLFDTAEDAKAALFQFWDECNEALQNNPSWMKVL
ncbi:hypothetical protein LOY34_17250 [Pseudomonas sp. B21-009]|uniref:hypothetical protein n=1 Tax=Pseudomonas sp. B21-009 TaxID=2895470 RepID=UPI00215EA329|nr:hypothetical protein [Pseudomonas sp. B21-009]UVM65080.1 hypothetical protein LOY34_17250 [Pseudomonas sp. B21-009]